MPIDQFELLHDLMEYSNTPIEGLDGAPSKAPVSQVATKPTSEGMPINQFKQLHDMMAER